VPTETLLAPINDFLGCETPKSWIDKAIKPENLAVLLVDHANCEKKAASTALNLIYRYTDNFELLNKMSRLVREEMRHFEQVIKIMKQRDIPYQHISASRYAAGLREVVRKDDPGRLVDVLIVGAFIEARSCERFAKIAPHLDSELKAFYQSLLKSEARHYQDYLALATKASGNESIDQRIAVIRSCEQQLIQDPDVEFRFHSGAFG
jgi:tRNA-(ms[2]io[6]A)-hydroxylase